MSDELTQKLIRNFINYLPYAMAAVFVVAAFSRWMIYYTVRRHNWFARQFELRVHKYLDTAAAQKSENVSFYLITKKLLERTFYETFAVRDRKSSESVDHIMSVNDRIFLIKQGCAWLTKDLLKQIKYLKWSKETPKLQQITRATLNHNPCFNKLFGIFPIQGLNDLISMLPGLFVVAGILGTFLGIKGGLVQLGGMDITDVEGTKTIMDSFLHEIGFAMASSIVGIAFSLALHVFNTTFSPERVFASLVDRFENTLDLVWYRSDNNLLPQDVADFNENRDPAEALAEEALSLEIIKSQREIKAA
jgi:hypothetical protein